MTYSGFIVKFERERTDGLVAKINAHEDFFDSYSNKDILFGEREICFLCLSARFTGVHAMSFVQRVRGSGGNAKPKFKYSNHLVFANLIKKRSLDELFGQESYLSDVANGIRLDPQKWTCLIELAKKLNPAQDIKIDQVLSLINKESILTGNSNRELRLNEQRDAIGTCIDIIDSSTEFRQKTLQAISPRNLDTAQSILDLIDDIKMYEQDAISHDKELIEKMFGNDSIKGAIFKDGKFQVRVYITDKKPLEEVLGTDLLIYHEQFKSFLLIQYKMMEKDQKSYHYKLDGQFTNQFKTMERILGSTQNNLNVANDTMHFRLNYNPFYFKFCERRKYGDRDESLLSGMCVDFYLLKQYLGDCAQKNSQSDISSGSLQRYLSPTRFVELARDGWIGSGESLIELIRKLLEASKSGGRNTVLAVIDAYAPPPLPDNNKIKQKRRARKHN